MLSPWLIIVFLVLAAGCLFISSTLSVVAASNSYASPSYSSNKDLHSAHTYLTIAASLGWLTFVILVLMLIFIIYLTIRDKVDVRDLLRMASLYSKKDQELSPDDKLKLTEDSVHLHHFRRSLNYFMISLIIVVVINILMGVLAAMAASKLASVPKDSNVTSAYTSSIITAILGLPVVILTIIAAIIGWVISSKDKGLNDEIDKELDLFRIK